MNTSISILCCSCFRDMSEVKNMFYLGDDEYICDACSEIEQDNLEREWLETECNCSKFEPRCGMPNCEGYWT